MSMVSTDEYEIADPLIQNGKSLLSAKIYTVNENWVKPNDTDKKCKLGGFTIWKSWAPSEAP